MILIILPVKNERKLAIEMALKLKGLKTEVLFVDDGSTDGTFEALNLIKSQRIRAVKNPFDRGKGSTLKAGYIFSEFMYKLGDGDLICFLDGDGQIDPSEIDTLKRIMEFYSGDVCIGNKRHIYSSSKYTRLRRIVSETYNALVRLLFDIKYQDTQCGIKIFKKQALGEVIEKVNVKRYAFDLELLVALKEKGFRVVDAPVKIKEQSNAGSVKISTILHTFLDTLKIWIKRNRGCYV